MDKKTEKPQKVYEKNRFEFSIFVNDNFACNRNFRINNFMEDSFGSYEFLDAMDEIVDLIDNDLKSKSRVYEWYMDGSDIEEDEDEKQKPWETTFKIVISDNGRPVFTKIWDGSQYPKEIRQNVDIINRFIQIGVRTNGEPIYVELDKIDIERLGNKQYVKYHIANGRKNLSDIIIKKICEVCSPEKAWYSNGKLVKSGRFSHKNDYTPIDDVTEKRINEWGKLLKDKTDRYFKEECFGMFSNDKKNN